MYNELKYQKGGFSMIRRSSEKNVETKKLFNGEGQVILQSI